MKAYYFLPWFCPWTGLRKLVWGKSLFPEVQSDIDGDVII